MAPRISTEEKVDQFIDPARTYTLKGFCAASGLNYPRVRTAIKQGVPFDQYSIGRRRFIDGSAAISFIHALRDLHLRQEAAKQESST